ncbi:uncharacterized protein LOC142175926 [Nicotiana tabacum]|uniref:Uncharacterized protein LOC142175926 n=1 Tax=Nicotiana tabacum TaxID=4097 RepID=A0AC58TP87_TOBAC
MDIVEQAWSIDVSGSPLWKFHLKLKNTCKMLSQWSRISVGNIFTTVKSLEDNIAMLELNLPMTTQANRVAHNQSNVKIIRAYKKEKAFWRQNFGIKWFVDGEVNTRFFHSVVKGKKRRLILSRLQDDNGNRIEGNQCIA